MRTIKIIFFALLLGIINIVNAQTFTWTGSSNTNWTDEANWDDGDGFSPGDGYPDGTSDDVIIPNVSANPIINNSGIICGDVTIQSLGNLTCNNGSNTLTATSIDLQSGGQLVISNGEITVNGDFNHSGILTLQGGTLDINNDYTGASSLRANISGGTIEIAGDWDGTAAPTSNPLNLFNPSGGTVFFNGGTAQSISTHASNNFHNLTFGGGVKTNTVGSDLVVNGNLLISSGTLDMAADANTLDVEGNFTLSGVSFIPYAGVHDIAGNWDDSGNDGGFTPSAGTVTLSGSGTTITTGSNNNFFNLTSIGLKTVQSNLDIDGDFTVSSGNFKLLTNECTVSGTTDVDGSLTISSGTFTANGPSDISGVLTIITSGIYDANGTFTASGGNIAFSVGSTGFLKLNNTVTALGTLTQTAGTVVYDGASTQSIVTDNYFNLTIDQSGIKQALGT